MINIFISTFHTYTIKPFLNTWSNKAASHIRLIPYEKLYRIKRIYPGLFVFSDIDRLTIEQHQMAKQLCEQILANFGENMIFNNPAKVLSRHQLLSLLWKHEINKFRVFSLGYFEEPIRYPVFIRRANDHTGSLTDLITNEPTFHKQFQRLRASSENPAELIAVEFCDTRSTDGLFRKYSAFRIGDAIIPAHIIFSSDWVTKDMPPEFLREEEKQYLENNPHREELMRIFDMANIKYGRIDYGLLEGKIQVWEINTNPVIIQKRSKYAKDKLPLKQKLVDELAEAFLARNAQVEEIMTQSESLDVNLASSVFLNIPQQFIRFACPLKL